MQVSVGQVVKMAGQSYIVYRHSKSYVTRIIEEDSDSYRKNSIEIQGVKNRRVVEHNIGNFAAGDIIETFTEVLELVSPGKDCQFIYLHMDAKKREEKEEDVGRMESGTGSPGDSQAPSDREGVEGEGGDRHQVVGEDGQTLYGSGRGDEDDRVDHPEVGGPGQSTGPDGGSGDQSGSEGDGLGGQPSLPEPAPESGGRGSPCDRGGGFGGDVF